MRSRAWTILLLGLFLLGHRAALAGDGPKSGLSSKLSRLKNAAATGLCKVYDNRIFPGLMRATTSRSGRLVSGLLRRLRGVEPTVDKRQLISETEPVQHSEGERLATQGLAPLIEPGLRQAVCQLQRLGVRTISSSANKKDLGRGYAYIVGDYSQLSEKNRAVVDNYHGGPQPGRGKGPPRFRIKIAIDRESTVGDVHKRSIRAINRFETQTSTTIARKRFSLDQVLSHYGYSDNEIRAMTPAERKEARAWFIEQGFAWDAKSRLLYADNEACVMANPSRHLGGSLRLLGRILLEPPH